MAKIGLVVRDGRPAIVDLAMKVVNWAKESGFNCIFETETANILKLTGEILDNKSLAAVADPIVTLGGDGTMIGVARHAGQNSPRLLGVNFGTLGFLTELSPSELIDSLAATVKGTNSFATRSMLNVDVMRSDISVFDSQAINEVVIQKGSRDPLLNLDVYCDNEQVMRIRADGLIFCTPTGSTAYSLAAGGAILHRSLDVMQITPICPHLLTTRPLVLPLDSKLEVRVPEHRGEIFISVDGQASASLVLNDSIRITKSQNSVKIVRSPSNSYYDILRGKLNWSIPNQHN